MSVPSSASSFSYIPSLEGLVKNVLAPAVGIATVGFGLLYYGQSFLIYPSAFPPNSRTEVLRPSAFGLPDYEELILETPDNVRIRGYLLLQRRKLVHTAVRASPNTTTSAYGQEDGTVTPLRDKEDNEYAAGRPTVIMFHGNGGNLGHRIILAKQFVVQMRCNVFMLSYRGYGLSEGTPSEKGIVMDAQTTLNFITSHPVLAQTRIVLYGQSIGGAVAVDLASRNPHNISAIILENTFLSLPRLVPSVFPLLSRVAFLCHQKWNSASKVPLLPPSIPALMLSGEKDEIVPPAHMHELERLLRTSMPGSIGQHDGRGRLEGGKVRRPGKMITFGKGMHNDTCTQPGYWAAVRDFIAEL